MLQQRETPTPQRMEIVLYRCSCEHCDTALRELNRLARSYGALLDVRRVDLDPRLEGYAGWRTPVVYIDGREVSHYQINVKRWEEALKESRVNTPSMLIGEIIDLHCYMSNKARGSEHQRCYQECLQNGSPIGLLAPDGQLYLLIPDPAYRACYERLQTLAADEVRVTGDVYERGGLRSVIVRNVEIVSPGRSLA